MVYFELGMAQTPCPTGTIQFMVDGNLASTVTLPGSNCGTPVEFKTATLTPGTTHNVTAVYSGDTFYAGATTGPVAHSVTAGATTVTLSSTAQNVNVGQSVTFTATVTPASEDAGAQPPTGNVSFLDAGVQIGTGALTSNAPYTSTFTTTLAAGPHSISANYVNSDGLYAGNSSSTTVETNLQVSDTASNVGLGTAPGSQTGFYISVDGQTKGTFLGARFVNGLGAAAVSGPVTTTMTIPATVKGTYYLLACADYNNVVAESNETNNCSASSVTMQVQ
jgi:hypothetical protein